MRKIKLLFRWGKRIFLIVLLLTLGLAVFYWDLLLYGFRQGYGQLQIIWNTRPISEVLRDSTISDSIKRKLLYIQEVKDFAEQELGLKKTENYTTFYDQKGKPLLWVVTACKPFELVPY
ncbi:MAG: aminopeptidase, partial [Raineya sp.]|nr:aminopeptidase [Raineya sp.]